MLCPRCHKINPPGARFCSFCRQDLTAPADSVREAPQKLVSVSYSIGRSKDNDIRIAEDSVSRHHAKILSFNDGTWLLEDLDSKNGTFVDGHRIRKKRVNSSSHIAFGTVNLIGSNLFKKIPCKRNEFQQRNSHSSDDLASVAKRKDISLLIVVLAAIAALTLGLFWTTSHDFSSVDGKNHIGTAQQEDNSASNKRAVEYKIERATVLVVAQTPSGFGLGSGFFINDNAVLTNRHVVQNAHRIIILNKHIALCLSVLVRGRITLCCSQQEE